MSEKSELISRLQNEFEARVAYIRATLTTLIPSQLKALRFREEWTQKELGEAALMKQGRLSMVEKPGAVNFALGTLIKLAAAYKVGLQVRFVPYSEMLEWENEYSQDEFKPARLDEDLAFWHEESALDVPREDTLRIQRKPPGSQGFSDKEREALGSSGRNSVYVMSKRFDGAQTFENGEHNAGHVDTSRTNTGIFGDRGAKPPRNAELSNISGGLRQDFRFQQDALGA